MHFGEAQGRRRVTDVSHTRLDPCGCQLTAESKITGKLLVLSLIHILCGGIAEYFRVDSTIIRLIFVVLALGAMSGVLIYLLAALIMPEEPYYEDKTKE